jgi:hypothetical protein
MLPEDTKAGVCPVCGTPSGARANALAATLANLEAAHRQTQADRRSAASTSPASPAPGAAATSSVPLSLIVGLAMVLAGLILAFLTLVGLRS